VATWLANRDPKGAHGTNAFLFAGFVLLGLALPETTGMLLSLPVLAAAAFWAAVMSGKWHSGSVRLTSYFMQIYASVTLALVLLNGEMTFSLLASVISAGGIACMGLLQYRWCRRRKPPEESAYFSKIDKQDFSAVTVLLAALLSLFFMLRVIFYHIAAVIFSTADLNNVLRCSQSVIINVSAVVLMLFALAQRSKELRNVAILVTVIGAVNVFLYDLIRGHGIPLVISVLSFGFATAVESVILGRWQRLPSSGPTPT